MKRERFSEEKTVGILREAENGEKPAADLCREHGIAEQTYCRRPPRPHTGPELQARMR